MPTTVWPVSVQRSRDTSPARHTGTSSERRDRHGFRVQQTRLIDLREPIALSL